MQYLLCVKGIGINYENIIKVLNLYRVEANWLFITKGYGIQRYGGSVIYIVYTCFNNSSPSSFNNKTKNIFSRWGLFLEKVCYNKIGMLK
mgnify:CR=1 FL=1